MSSPLILTLLAGSATFIGAIFGVIGQKPSNRLLGFSLGFAAGIMLLISLMEMLPAALAAEGMSPLLGYGMFVVGLLGYFGLDRLLPHAHPQDLMIPAMPRPRNLRRTAILLTLGISLHNFPEGIATYVTASNNLELGMGVAPCRRPAQYSGRTGGCRTGVCRHRLAQQSGALGRAFRHGGNFGRRAGVVDSGEPGLAAGDGRDRWLPSPGLWWRCRSMN